MSEKPTAAELEFDKSKEAAHESKEDFCLKKEHIPNFSHEEICKTVLESMAKSKLDIFSSHEREFTSHPKPTATDMEKAAAMSTFLDRTHELFRPDEIGLKEFQESLAAIKPKPPSFIIKDSKICCVDDLEVESPSKSEFHKVPKVSQKLHPKTTSEMSTSAKLEAPEEICQMSKTISETSNEPEDRQVPINQMLRNTSETSLFKMLTFTKIDGAPEIPDVAEVCQIPKTTSETSISKKTENPEVAEIHRTHSMSKISDKAEELEIPEVRQTHSTAAEISVPIKFDDVEDVEVDETRATSEVSISDKVDACERVFPLSMSIYKMYTFNEPEDHQVPVCQMVKNTSETSMSEMFTLTEFDAPESLDIAEVCQIPKPTLETFIIKTIEDPEVAEIRRTHSMSKISDKTEEPEIPEVRRTHTATEISVPIMFDNVKFQDVEVDETRATSEVSTSKSGDKKKFTEDIKDDVSKISTKLEETSLRNMRLTDETRKIMTQISQKLVREEFEPIRFPRKRLPMSAPNFKEPYLVLATQHMVPSLPIALFEVLAEMIEVVTKRPVVLLHECREDRHIATEIADIVVLPPYETWTDGVLLPASFVFEHEINHDNSALMYADVIVTNDRAPHIKDIMDLRGHRCAIPNERNDFSPTAMLLTHLYMKGENMLFFGTVFDAGAQLEVLKMVASKQAEVGIVESSVLRYHKNQPGMESIHVLTSLGPMPPYRIMIKNKLADTLSKKLTTYLLDTKKSMQWTQRLLPFGVLGFHKNSEDYYKVINKNRLININIPYY